MPKLILDRRTMRIIRAQKPTPAKPLPDVSGEDGYPATLKAVAVPATPTPTGGYTIMTELADIDIDGRVVLTYR